MVKVIYICGTPGTGKTTLSKYLEKYGFYIINLPQFLRDNKLYLGYDAIRDSLIINEKSLIKKIKETIHEINSKFIAIEGIGAEILPPELATLCVVLVCEPKELEKRLRVKRYPEEKIRENLEAERLSVILGEALEYFGNKVVVYDTSKLGIKEIVADLLERLEFSKRGV